jgi:hypothetical protein
VLADLSTALLEVARRCAAEADASGVESFDVVNATDLERYADAWFEAVIGFWPFYHLVADAERRRAAAEIRCVLGPRGEAFIAFIPRLGGLIALIHRAAARPAQVRDTVLRVAVDTGAFSIRRRPASRRATTRCRASSSSCSCLPDFRSRTCCH